MITLGIETSGREGSVALIRDGILSGQRDLSREGRRHARTLVAEICNLLQESGIQPQDVETIAASIGPGSFTGLRVGVTCAKTWAYATGAKVVAVDTFLAIASQSTTGKDQLHVISDAQRDDLFVGRFRRSDDAHWERQSDIEIMPVDDWVESLEKKAAVTGPAVETLNDRLTGRCHVETESAWNPSAESVARLGERAARQGATHDFWQLEPTYLRRSAAEEKAEASPG